MMSKKSANKLFFYFFRHRGRNNILTSRWCMKRTAGFFLGPFLFLALCTVYYVPSSKASTLVVKIKESIVSRLGVRNKIPFFLFIILHGVVFTSLDSSYSSRAPRRAAPSRRVRRARHSRLVCAERDFMTIPPSRVRPTPIFFLWMTQNLCPKRLS